MGDTDLDALLQDALDDFEPSDASATGTEVSTLLLALTVHV